MENLSQEKKNVPKDQAENCLEKHWDNGDASPPTFQLFTSGMIVASHLSPGAAAPGEPRDVSRPAGKKTGFLSTNVYEQ